MEAQACVYILASKRNGTLYTGVTRYPLQRIWQHKTRLVEGFTKKYGVHLLVYIEPHDTIAAAIAREKQIKEWKRAWKLELIENMNPDWRDLMKIFASSRWGTGTGHTGESRYPAQEGLSFQGWLSLFSLDTGFRRYDPMR